MWGETAADTRHPTEHRRSMRDVTTPTVFPLMGKHANSVDTLLLKGCVSQTWSLTTTSEYRPTTLDTDEAPNPHSTDGNDRFRRHLKRLIDALSLVQNRNAKKRDPALSLELSLYSAFKHPHCIKTFRVLPLPVSNARCENVAVKYHRCVAQPV